MRNSLADELEAMEANAKFIFTKYKDMAGAGRKARQRRTRGAPEKMGHRGIMGRAPSAAEKIR